MTPRAIVFALLVALPCAPAARAATDSAKNPRSTKAKAPAGKSAPKKRVATPNPEERKASDPQREQAEQTAERARLVERIQQLKREIALGEKARGGATASLVKAERALVETDRRLEQLESQQRALHGRIVDLDRQRATTISERNARRDSLARTTVAAVVNNEADSISYLLTGRDPTEILTDGIALDYAARVDRDRIAALDGRTSDLEAQRQRADAETRALAERAESQKASKATLVADQNAQRDALAKIARKLDEQRKSASALEADEKRLAKVIDDLQRAIARRAAEEAARKEAQRRRAEEEAARAARNARGPSSPSRPPVTRTPPPTPVETVPDAASGSGEFAQLRGRLRLPSRGALTARFGAPRGDGGASWKGVFIRTAPQAEVHAVAGGRVVFADYLRGFGNLLIVDHGDHYLSIYGNNETILKRSGETVKAGDVLSLSGDSSGDGETGLYFELRYRGKPFDPMAWVGSR